MPRQPRLDAPLGYCTTLWARDREGTKVFRNQPDRKDFLERVAGLCDAGAWVIYAWALMANHLLVRSAKESLPFSNRRLVTGYVVNFNRRH